MPVRPQPPTDQPVNFPFPVSGIDLSTAYSQQRPGTTPVGLNVRAFDPTTGRARGGQRPGLVKYIATTVNSTNALQCLDVLVGAGYSPPGGGPVAAPLSGRVVTLMAIAGGTLKVNSGGTTWHSPTGAAGFNSSVPVIRSAANGMKMWFADGVDWKYYDPTDDTVHTWSASAGSLPTDMSSNTPTLICTWRSRTVLSGLISDPQNWFMSRAGDPTNFDYSPLSTSPQDAVAGNNAPQGLIGDVITSLIPYNDDLLVFGGDHTIYQMSGDPMDGGRVDLVSDGIGMAPGIAWARDPYGVVYFFSNRCGIYTMVPGAQAPARISQGIEETLATVNTEQKIVRMLWNERMQGLHVFITTPGTLSTAQHLFWEMRTGAWWTDIFASGTHNGICCTNYDGDSAIQRVSLIGSDDGYVRALSNSATTDDGAAPFSAVVFGPILTPDLDDMMLMSLQAVLGTSSGSVTYEVYVGSSAEAALNGSPVLSGTWGPGRNLSNYVRRSGHAVYVKITATNAWSLESIRAMVKAKGRIRQRGA